jgi:hypothetical protein
LDGKDAPNIAVQPMVAATPKQTFRRRAGSTDVGGFLLVCFLIADGAFGQSPFRRVWPMAE